MSDSDPKTDTRRTFLRRACLLTGGAGVVVTSWPFLRSMYPTPEARARGVTTVNLKHIKVGESEIVTWQGKPVFVVHRTSEQIAETEKTPGGFDPQADAQRVIKPEWLVVVGVCTHLGCVPNRRDNGWLCPCHGSAYDNSGRVIHGPAPRNLAVPPYTFTADDKLVIGEKA